MEFITLASKDKVRLIKDVLLYPLKVNKDDSGILIETLRADWQEIYGKGREFAMQYLSVTKSSIARDEKIWHYHFGQEDRFLIAQGEIIVAVADNREESQTKGILNLFHMKTQEDPYVLLIPRGTLHGFLVVSKEDAILLNFPTSLYNPSDELRMSYEEAQIKLPDGSLFSWDQVRSKLGLNIASNRKA